MAISSARRSSDYLTVVALCGILLCIVLLMGHSTTFFLVDQDMKYLAASSLAQHWNNAAIPYPFHTVDPHGVYSLPLTAWINGRDYAGYSLPFEYLGAAALSVFGPAGLALPALVGTAMLLLIQLQLASLLGFRGQRSLMLVATVMATPISFYSLLFWEHTWGVALLLAGIAVLLTLAARRHPSIWGGGLAGLLFASGVLMRREVLVATLVALVLIPAFFRSRGVLLMSGAAAAAFMIPLGMIYQLHPQPLLEGLTHASPGRSPNMPSTTRLRRLEWLTSGGYATALFAALTVLLVSIRVLRTRWLAMAFILSSIVAGFAFVIQLFSHYTWSNLNPLAFCPLAIWGLWSILFLPSEEPDRSVFLTLWLTCLAGAVATVVMAADYGAGQWGPRYLLFVFPLLILLAFRAVQGMRIGATGAVAKRTIGFGFVGVLTFSILLQGVGVGGIVVGKQELSTAQAAIAKLQPPVVASADPSIDGLAPLAGHKMLLYAPTLRDLPGLMTKIRQGGYRSVVLICGPPAACKWNGFDGWTRGPIETKVRKVFKYAIYTAS